MKVRAEDKVFIVKWQHQNNGNGNESKTNCFIRLADQEGTISSGEATCSVNDQYCKNTGRKVSMARALKPFGRPIRKKFWYEYMAEIGIEG